ncbi:hypothetical protein L210DRAFT_3508301 [Boletus edulis BED1]|uniref:Uncharacterized protein n=1 Tax=Boletus edulis BED1 TaxID=1328754 RepID=A0AAD4G8J7_BOLED|nr:hypothetical protein L210DRAFT_3508301 [Boletus edulis BED1]
MPGSLRDDEGHSSVDHTAYEETCLDPEPIIRVHPSAESEGWTTVTSKKKPSKYGRSQKGNISTYNAQRSEEEESVPDKGKELDPRNWGQLDLDSDELDPNVQQSVLEQWNNRQTEKQTESDKEIVISEDREKAKYAKAFKRQRL